MVSNVPLRIGFTVKSKNRQVGEYFRPTIMWNEHFNLETTTSNYVTDFPTFLNGVWAYIQDQIATCEIDVHYEIRIENITGPAPATGSWIQAKVHFDGWFAQGDIPTPTPIQDTIYQVIATLASNAKYDYALAQGENAV